MQKKSSLPVLPELAEPGSPGLILDSDPRNPWAGIMMTAFAAFGGILFGYDTGTINGIKEMKDFLRRFGHPDPTAPFGYALTTTDESLVVSILSAGTFVGALLAAPIADGIGRRLGIVFTCLVFSAGVAMQTVGTSFSLFVVGRVFAGLGVGLVSCLVPLYQSECAPKWIRGAVVSCYQWAITIGLLLAAIVNNSTKDHDNASSWRIPTAIQFAWAVVLAGGMFLLPESPRYLVKRRNEEGAKKSLARLLGTKDIQHPAVLAEYKAISTNLRLELELGQSGYRDCFKQGPNKILFRVLTGIFIQAWQQLTGINFIFYYGTTFFTRSGITNPYTIIIATNVVNVGMTIPALWAVDRIGRRKMLMIGALGMLVCEYLIAIIGVTISVDNLTGQRVLIAFSCVYIAFFASTWGPITWCVIGEIFPLAVRAKAMSLSTSSNWLFNFGIGYAIPYLLNTEYANLETKVFFIWGTTCLGCLVFTYFCIPETKGLSLEQIDVLYQNTSVLQAQAYRHQLIAHAFAQEQGEAYWYPMNSDVEVRSTRSRWSHSSAAEKAFTIPRMSYVRDSHASVRSLALP